MIKKLAKICQQSYSGVFDDKALHSLNVNGVQAYILDSVAYDVLVFRGSDGSSAK